MGNIVFKPWIGSNYTSNKFGARILVLGESHYGSPEDEYEDYTVDVVKMWGQENRLAFFTKIAKTLLNYDSSNYLNEHERHTLWENVSFYNYVQAIVGEGARIRPSDEMWKKSEVAFQEVIERLDPQIIIVLGMELAENLPKIPEGIEVCFLNHPSSGGYSYAVNNQLVQNSIETVKSNDDLMLATLVKEEKLDKSFTLVKIQRQLLWGNWGAKEVCVRAVSRDLLSFIEIDNEIVYTVLE
ncbi:Putative uncharacterized protein [Moritella viscosa]|uniref:hypothetical protein n=1 Tax=Moritella viscosa TaxID=80854 RepID=UPI00090F8EF9|nr:hypothetical protein [Moritella viscosa]SHO23031.1 Putative uncharacterized protein [Moritella viscosa]